MANSRDQNTFLVKACGFALFVAFTLWMILSVPMSQDETSLYHALSCSDHTYAYLNSFAEPCDGSWTLTTPLGFTYVLNYPYLGGLSSFLYAPFFRLFHSPLVEYLYGLLFFLLFAFGLSRLTSKPWLSFFVFLPFFPALFQFVHDTGEIKFACLAFVLVSLLYRDAIGKRLPLQIAAGLGAGLLVAIATEDKIYFLFLLLPLFFFALAETGEGMGLAGPFSVFVRGAAKGKFFPALRDFLTNRNCGWPFLFSLVLAAAIGLAFLFLSKVSNGQFYIISLLGLGPRITSAQVLDDFRQYTLLWSSFANRVFDPEHVPAKYPLQIATLAFIGACVYAYRKNAGLASFSPLRVRLMLYSVLSFAIILLAIHKTWSGHHYIFLWIPLLALFAELVAGLEKSRALALVIFYFALNIASVSALAIDEPFYHTTWEREKIFAYFDTPSMAAHSIVAYSSWGGYETEALYSPRDALVISIGTMNPSEASRLYEISLRTRRRIYDVCISGGCSAEELAQAFNHRLRFEEVNLGMATWHVFAAATPR